MIDQLLKIFCRVPVLVFISCLSLPCPAAAEDNEINLNSAGVLVGSGEPSYVQYASQDLARYLSNLIGHPVPVMSEPEAAARVPVAIAVGAQIANGLGFELPKAEPLGPEGAMLHSFRRGSAAIVAVAGRNPHGTNMGVATLMRLIESRGREAYLRAPLDLISKPDIRVRGFHMNGGWQLNHPYGFRTWTEDDWKRFVDIVWSQRGNLVFIWPYIETMTLPLSEQDQAYLEEFRRIVEYAQKQRGMEVWIMQSANRVAVTNCGEPDPRLRPHWVDGCQKDMNPADAMQFANIIRSFEALYRVVDNADAFCLIDSDPGGWPQSPVSDQLKIFRAARNLLNRYNINSARTKLVDWMWLGWGRHKYFSATEHLVTGFDWSDQNPDKSDVAFMAETIRSFKSGLPEPWELVSGFPQYLDAASQESVIQKTIFLPYGAIEMEPAFPATNMGFSSLRETLRIAVRYPGLRGWMGNNELMLLQMPRSFYFMSSLWDYKLASQSESVSLRELARLLYPDHVTEITSAFQALQEKDPKVIRISVQNLMRIQEHRRDQIQPGAIGRFLFGGNTMFITDLQMQLEIRLSRQELISALQGTPDVNECARLTSLYFDKVLAWNSRTGWDKTINIGIWNLPLYDAGPDLTAVLSRMKQVLGRGAPYTSYAQIESFFAPIAQHLATKYEYNSVMLGCVEPFKLAVAQTQ